MDRSPNRKIKLKYTIAVCFCNTIGGYFSFKIVLFKNGKSAMRN